MSILSKAEVVRVNGHFSWAWGTKILPELGILSWRREDSGNMRTPSDVGGLALAGTAMGGAGSLWWGGQEGRWVKGALGVSSSLQGRGGRALQALRGHLPRLLYGRGTGQPRRCPWVSLPFWSFLWPCGAVFNFFKEPGFSQVNWKSLITLNILPDSNSGSLL